MKKIKLILPIIIALVIGFALRGFLTPSPPQASSPTPQASIWTCSMHPQIQLPKAGKCPICFMDLIPLESGNDEGGEREIRISAYAAKLMELETTEVIRDFAEAELRMVGKVDYDETRISTISAWVSGRIDRLFVDSTGIPVKKGEHLAELYSPDLVTAQEELLQAIKHNPSLVDSAREKLRLWGFTAQQVADIETRGASVDHMTIYSPVGGIVIHKNAQEGLYIKTGTPIYTIADLSNVWVQLDAYESDLSLLRYGSSVTFTTATYPGETFEGTITFIDPIINTATRTAKVRVIVENKNDRLKPGMFIRAVARPKVAANGHVMDSGLAGKWISPMHPEVIKDGPGSCDVCGMPLVTAESLGYVEETDRNAPLLIPITAALKTGKRAVVYVEIPNSEKPSYEGREVQLGQRLGNFYVVESGLEEGERVVTRGAFKLDAELQLRAKPSMMSPPEEKRVEAEPNLQPLKAPEAFTQQLEAVLQTYFGIHATLAGDDPTATQSAAQAMQEKLKAVNMGLLEGDAHRVWMDQLKMLNGPLGKIAKSNDMEKQRDAFYPLSQQLAQTIQVFPLNTPVLQAFCSMAFDNTGATWLQQSEEVLNPYFGDMMLHCGEIQETIGASK